MMESKQIIDVSKISDERLQNMVKNLGKCKIDIVNEKEECKKLREVNVKLELELKETRELEKSHRYHLQTSREMIGNLQDTVSQLVYLKRDVKKLKDDVISKDTTIIAMEKDKENIQQSHNESIAEIRKAHECHIEELKSNHDQKLLQVQYECDTQIAQFTCAIAELKAKIKDLEKEHREKMNVVVLEYEEQIQKSAVELSHLHEQQRMKAARNDANIEAYRKKLEDLEDKLKQSQFKEYLAQSNYPSQSSFSHFENRVERPFSGQRDYTHSHDFKTIPVCPSPKPTSQTSHRNFKTPSLQVTYDSKPLKMSTNEKIGPIILKKRKLFNEKDFLNQ